MCYISVGMCVIYLLNIFIFHVLNPTDLSFLSLKYSQVNFPKNRAAPCHSRNRLFAVMHSNKDGSNISSKFHFSIIIKSNYVLLLLLAKNYHALACCNGKIPMQISSIQV